ncbi:acetyltransferase, GNAT family [Ancylostoma caninum]|uniref:N-terminal methionine N(alpha)-acetyltransferase NatE n=1 Tax=Ancylostoma caninum TaxID=29170 RepID=A0A368H0L0_ANCCA|nr:acetyltransferase, GNAT family [Ancylostoma caninum]
MAPAVEPVDEMNALTISGKKKKKIAGRCDMELGDVTPHNVKQLRTLNSCILPVPYNAKFYANVVADGKMSKLAYVNDIVVGAVCCRIDEYEGKRSLYIMTLGTLAPYRQLGVGNMLLNYVFSLTAKDPTIENIFLHVQTSNETALNFYKNRGFEQVGIEENYYKHVEPKDAYTMVKRMKS